jgi:hypothetical protein
MARKRFISPSFFTHGALYDAETSSGLPLRLAFAGLWTASDRRGLFEWKPRELKLAILPYDTADFSAVLSALEAGGFVERYVVDGKTIGRIPSFVRWQTFHPNEKPSDLPAAPSGSAEPTKGRPEPESGRVSRAVVTAVAVTASTTTAVAVAYPVAGAVADTSSAQAPPQSELKAPNSPTDQSPIAQLGALMGEFDFGAAASSVDGLVRAARNPAAIIATLRMHLSGELGHELATPPELALACQQFLANGEDFNAAFFAGFIRRAKKGVERTGNRRRNDREDRVIAGEVRDRAAAEADNAAADSILKSFAEEHPERYRAIAARENANVPMSLTTGREEIVRARMLTAIRREIPKAGAA